LTGQHPNYAPGVAPYAANRNRFHWLNPAAFVTPAPGTFGNVGRNVLSGPRAVTLNAALVRHFPVVREDYLEFRAEGFNILNHVNPGVSSGVNGFTASGGPVVVVGNSQFGKLINAADPRILQFAMKFIF